MRALHFVTCGSVDDGKSTLIGRLLWETNQVFEDHMASLRRDSARYGTQGETIDLALLLDGLEAEREQNITIDVAYRFFRTPRRSFVIADAPGHEQYIRNMVTGVSASNAALLVVDASKGLQIQTHRHTRIVATLGIRNLIVAVNKMDLMSWSQARFFQILEELRTLTVDCGFVSFHAIPVAALYGDNVITHSAVMPWYSGASLLNVLEELEPQEEVTPVAFRMPVQYVNRASSQRRGYCGRIASGDIGVGERVCIMPGRAETRVRSISTWKQDIPRASAGDCVTICVDDEVDASRGSVISSLSDPVEMTDQCEATIVCVAEQSLLAGQTYVLRMHTCQAMALVTTIKHRVDVLSGKRLGAQTLEPNDIGVVTLSFDRAIPFQSFKECKRLGSFILIDRLTNQTVAGGMIGFALRGAANIQLQPLAVSKAARAAQKLQKPVCLWFTGLPAAGKSTIASLLEKRLFQAGRHTYVLDGDNVRGGLNNDLGFSEADRVENIRRVTEVAKLFVDAGLMVIVSLISPYRAERETARSHFAPEEFREVFIDAPLFECERRDPKGHYAKARRGELRNFTGVDSRYEAPTTPDIRLDTVAHTVEECVEQVLDGLEIASAVSSL